MGDRTPPPEPSTTTEGTATSAPAKLDLEPSDNVGGSWGFTSVKRKFQRRIWVEFKNNVPWVEGTTDFWEVPWYRIPYDSMRMSLTPRNISWIKTYDKMKLNACGFKFEQFQHSYDKEHSTTEGVTLDAVYNSPPTLWTMIDSGNQLPYADLHHMDETNLQTELSISPIKEARQLKTLQFPRLKMGGVDLYNEMDFDFFNRGQAQQLTLTQSWDYTYDCTMPWVALNANMVQTQLTGDFRGLWTLPRITVDGLVEKKLLLWNMRANSSRSSEQHTAISKLPWGGDIPLAMIRLNPLLLYDNAPIPMTISGWLTLWSSVTVATNEGLHGNHDTYEHKHWAGERNYDMGTKVKGDAIHGTITQQPDRPTGDGPTGGPWNPKVTIPLPPILTIPLPPTDGGDDDIETKVVHRDRT